MAATNGPSKVEGIKTGSDYLRGSMAEELLNDRPDFDGDTTQLLKFHGSYQQDDREKRKLKDADGNPLGKQFIMMLRTVIPGGVLTADQLLAHFDIADLLGYGTARLTSRQGVQLHGIPKGSLREAIRRINEIAMTTLAACGDVSRNVMCCPAPIKDDPVHAEMQQVAGRIKELMKPRSGAYYDLWLRDADDPEAEKLDVAVPEARFGSEKKFNGVDISEDRVREIGDSGDAVEPMYGLTYLPRKFKIGIALPEDNCADIYTQDIGLMVLRSADGRSIRGYNMIVGGGMGVTPAKKDTFPRVGDKMAFVKPEQLFEAIVAVVTVQRDHGNRENRKRARLKYLVHDKGIAWIRQQVEQRLGYELADPDPADVTGVEDHHGWHEQGDGKLYVGLDVPDGRIANFEEGPQWKSALREILRKYQPECRITALARLILADIDPADKADIEAILKKHGIKRQVSLLRRYAMACVALPTCGLAVTESERVLDEVVEDVETRIAQYGLVKNKIAIHMTGCPNGCARPYTPDIGLVGKASGKYTLFLGGNAEGTRIGFIYDDMVPLEEIGERVSGPLAYYRQSRRDGESFGDFCARVGKDGLKRYADLLAAETDTLDAEIGGLSDGELRGLIERFAADLSAEQIRRTIDEARARKSGSQGLADAIATAERRLDIFDAAT